jgi:hypothetical protein
MILTVTNMVMQCMCFAERWNAFFPFISLAVGGMCLHHHWAHVSHRRRAGRRGRRPARGNGHAGRNRRRRRLQIRQRRAQSSDQSGRGYWYVYLCLCLCLCVCSYINADILTGTDFKRKDGSRSNQARRGTWRKSMPLSSSVRPLYARHDAVVQASLDQLSKLTHGGKEDKIGSSKPDIDDHLKILFDPVVQTRIAYVNLCIKDLVEKHSDGLRQQLKDPMKSRAIKRFQGDTMYGGGRIQVNLSQDKLNSVYSLRIVSMRRARRRILGAINVFAIFERHMALSMAFLSATSSSKNHKSSSSEGTQELMSEMMLMQHTFEIDDDGVVHARDHDGELVVYDYAYNQLFQACYC